MSWSSRPVSNPGWAPMRALSQDLDAVVLRVCRRIGRLAHASEIVRLTQAESQGADAHEIRAHVLPRLLHSGRLRSPSRDLFGPTEDAA